MESLDLLKEKLTMDVRSLKNTLDVNIKQITEHQDTQEKRIKEFCYNILSTSEKTLKEDITEIKHNFSEIKMENGKYHLEAMKVVKQLNSEVAELHKMKVELHDAREKELKIIHHSVQRFKKNIFLMVQDFSG